MNHGESVKDLVIKSVTDTLSKKDQAKLTEWVNASDRNKQYYEKLVSVWRTKYEDPKYIHSNELLENILQEGFNEESFHRHNWFTRSQYLIKIAAILVVIFTLTLVLSQLNNSQDYNEVVTKVEKYNPPGVKSRIVLSDNSVVWLNAGSKITYTKGFSDDRRFIELEGEAFFEVQKDPSRPFIVKSGKVSTAALGTSFNIRHYAEDPRTNVSLLSGKVSVTFDQSDKLIYLDPNQEVIISRDDLSAEKRAMNDQKIIAWKDNVISFRNATLSEVIHTLERWYDVSIDTSEYQHERWKYESDFDNQSLETVLSRIGFSQGFEFTMEGKQIKIYNKRN